MGRWTDREMAWEGMAVRRSRDTQDDGLARNEKGGEKGCISTDPCG